MLTSPPPPPPSLVLLPPPPQAEIAAAATTAAQTARAFVNTPSSSRKPVLLAPDWRRISLDRRRGVPSADKWTIGRIRKGTNWPTSAGQHSTVTARSSTG